MSTIRIRKKLDSETLYLPELKPLLGRTVEITISESAEAACCAEAGHGPASQPELVAKPSANQGILNAIADVERIQKGMLPKDDKNTLTYLREARSGEMYGHSYDE